MKRRSNRERKTSGVRIPGSELLGAVPLPARATQVKQCTCDHTIDKTMFNYWSHPRTKAAHCNACNGELADTTEAQQFQIKTYRTLPAEVRKI